MTEAQTVTTAKLDQDDLHKASVQYGPGGIVKDKYDHAVASTGSKIWNSIREVGASGFGKGLLWTAVAVIGVMALVAGYMGATSTLAVGGFQLSTFEAGVNAGIMKALQFLTSGLGLATVAAGGAVGAAVAVNSHQNKLSGTEAERLGLELQRMREQQPQKAPQKAAEQAPAKCEEPHHAKPEQPRQKHDNDIYVKGSMVKEKNFCAAELKRRTEREVMVAGKA